MLAPAGTVDEMNVMSAPAEYVIVELVLPNRPRCNVGVLLLDPASGRLYTKLRDDWDAIAGKPDAEVLGYLHQDFEIKSEEMGGEAFLKYLEDTLSNTILLTGREPVSVTSFSQSLERLFEEHVRESKVIPFKTHLPVYSLRAAATKFSGDQEVEPKDWVRAPERLRLTEKMFVARVVGRSMEPLIPDGSLCIFEADVTGSRQGKHVLVQRLGVSDTSAEFSVKRYRSQKSHAGEDEWTHQSIRLEPLNKEFEPMEFSPEDENQQFRIIAKFVRVLE